MNFWSVKMCQKILCNAVLEVLQVHYLKYHFASAQLVFPVTSMLSWSSFYQCNAQYSFQDSGCFSVESGMNPVAMTMISPRKESQPSRGSSQRPPVFNSCTLTTKLHGVAICY